MWDARRDVGIVCLETSLSISLSLHDCKCICVCSTTCGRPRLALGLYRDYICKTIRLNHFLNKRTCPPSSLFAESSGPGQIGERFPRVRVGGQKGGGRERSNSPSWVKYSVARSTYARETLSSAQLTVSATGVRGKFPRSEINELARVTD